MRKIFLIRHGSPNFENQKKQCIGHTDYPMSKEGMEQIKILKQDVKNFEPCMIYTSPLQRCIETAEILSEKKIPIIIIPDFIEINMGIWENKTFDEIKKKYPQAYKQRIKEMGTFCVPGGESFKACQERVIRAFIKIAKETKGNLAIVTHAGVIRSLLCAITNTSLNEILSFKVPYGSLLTLQAKKEQEGFELTSLEVLYDADNS